MVNPDRKHWEWVKWLLKGVKGSLDVEFNFGSLSRRIEVERFVHHDFAEDLDKRRSTTGYVFILCGGPISWKLHCQQQIKS